MEGSDRSNQLPQEVRIMYERVPEKLRCELDALPFNKSVAVLKALNKFHHAIESEVYELALQLVRAAR